MAWYGEPYDELKQNALYNLPNFSYNHGPLQIPPPPSVSYGSVADDYPTPIYPTPVVNVGMDQKKVDEEEMDGLEDLTITIPTRPRRNIKRVTYKVDVDEFTDDQYLLPASTTLKKRRRLPKKNKPNKKIKSSFMELKDRILKALNTKPDSFFTIKEISSIFSRLYEDYEDKGSNRLSNAVHHLCKDGLLEKKYVSVDKSVNRRGIAVVFRQLQEIAKIKEDEEIESYET